MTSKQVALLMGLSRNAVMGLFDSGQLGGFRVGGRRMIPAEELLDFARKKGMNILAKKLVLAGCGVVVLTRTPEVLRACEGVADVLIAQSWYETAIALAAGRPRGLVLDGAIGRDECVVAAQAIRREPDRPSLLLVGYGDEPTDATFKGLWDHVVEFPNEVYRLAELLNCCQRR